MRIKGIRGLQALTPLLRLHPWAFAAIICLGILSSLAEGVGISLFIPFLQSIGQVSYHANTGNWLIDTLGHLFENTPSNERLLILSACIFGSVLLKAALSYGYGLLFAWLDARIGHQLRSGLFDQLLTVGYPFLERSKSGELLNTLSTESWQTSEALWEVVNFVITAFTLLIYVSLLLLISWQLTILVAGSMLLISGIVRLFTKQVKTLGKEANKSNAALAERMVEGLEGMKVIRAFGREDYEQARFDHASMRVSNVFMKLKIISGAVPTVYEILTAALLVFILYTTLQTPANLPALLVFIFVLYRLQPRVITLDRVRVNLASLAASVDDVTSLLSREDKPYILSGHRPFQALEEGIHFDQVTFLYNGSATPALRSVSITIPAGKTTALVGPSGAGKSTLIKLILRLYEATYGTIYADNTPLAELDLSSWRQRMSMVSQEVFVFNTTVRENIAYGKLDATEKDIIDAAKQADAHDFISQLPQGYDTLVGDRGIRLSGGQKQRITLARAIVRNPTILILDEATNSLDSISEQLIQEALDTLSLNRTVLVIAHRLSTIEKADHIIVLEDGHVREQGNLRYLMSIDGLFARLHSLQYRSTMS